MSANGSGRMLLNIRILADELEETFNGCTVFTENDRAVLRSCVMYCGQKPLREDLLYILPDGDCADFPFDSFCYISSAPHGGLAPHICGIEKSATEILNAVIAVFEKYHDFEMELNGIVTGGGSISDLLLAADPFFRNPMYVHDNLFAVIALPRMVEGMLKFEYSQKTGKIYIPLWLIEDFKFDENYRNTLSLHEPGIWGIDEYPKHFRSLFVNLWDGSYYCGRLLINELQTPLQEGQFLTATYLAEYILMILRRDTHSSAQTYRNFEQTFIDLMQEREVAATDLNAALGILGWREDDRYVCIRLRNQDERLNIKTITVLRSALASVISGFTSFFCDNDLCIVQNLSVSDNSYTELRMLLAEHVRDSYLYCGLSNPFFGIRNLTSAFRQTQIALGCIANGGSTRWIMAFEDCVVPYVLAQTVRRMRAEQVAAPDLIRLLEYDRKNGTEYFHTLRCYLLHERSIPATSEALIIHRTTLSYRLKKMKELMTLDLDNEDNRFYLLLSFRLLE